MAAFELFTQMALAKHNKEEGRGGRRGKEGRGIHMVVAVGSREALFIFP